MQKARKITTEKNVKQRQLKARKVIPVFYAADENYLPYLTVSLCSLKSNAKKEYDYEIYVLCEKMCAQSEAALKKYEDERFRITFVDVAARLEEVKEELQLRDYYTGATYYRIFIAGMFPQYNKALYFDSDTVICGDVADLYNVNLGSNLVGAVPDGAVAAVPQFCTYTKEALGIDPKKYFNAGVLVMNLAQFRRENFYAKFCKLLAEYKFSVAQDQDYLNVLCKNRVKYIGEEWNKMPIGGEEETPKLVHYNLTAKPWRYRDIPYSGLFWKYASQTEFYERLVAGLASYSSAERKKDIVSEKNLIALAEWEARRKDGYYKTLKARAIKRNNGWEEEYGYVEDLTGTPVYSKAH